MSENQIISETKLKQSQLMCQFIQVIKQHELSHSYLFNGNEGVGKLSLALFITMRMFCPNVSDDGMPCGQCNECRRIASQQHPDVVIVRPEGLSIKVDQIRYLKAEFAKSGLEGNQKFFIIEDADKMTNNAANSLLKFIEEPSANIVSFLLTTNRNLILPTILSRTQLINLKPLDTKIFNQELKKIGLPNSQMKLASKLTNRISTIKEWNDDKWLDRSIDCVGRWFDLISRGNKSSFVMVQTDLIPLVQDNSKKQLLINMLLSIFEDVLEAKYLETDSFTFPKHTASIQSLATSISEEKLVDAIEVILDCNNKMTINVGFQNILETITLRILKILK